MPTPLLRAVFLASLMVASYAAHAQDLGIGKVDLEASELSVDVIGAPVSDRTETEIGQVADISFGEDGQPDQLRVRVSSHLGFGERTVEVRRDTFIVLQGHVVVELSADDLRSRQMSVMKSTRGVPTSERLRQR